MPDLKKRVAAAIKAARLEKKYSQEQLATMAGIVTESLSALERGISLPALDTYVKLANALDLDTVALLDVPDPAAGVKRDPNRPDAEVATMARSMPDATVKAWLEVGAVLKKAMPKG